MNLQETLASKKEERDRGRVLGQILLRPFSKEPMNPEHDNDEYSSKHKRSEEKPVTYREVFTSQSSLNLLAYSILALHIVAYDQLVPVFLHHSPQRDRALNPEVQLPLKFAGGFGLDVSYLVLYRETPH